MYHLNILWFEKHWLNGCRGSMCDRSGTIYANTRKPCRTELERCCLIWAIVQKGNLKPGFRTIGYLVRLNINLPSDQTIFSCWLKWAKLTWASWSGMPGFFRKPCSSALMPLPNVMYASSTITSSVSELHPFNKWRTSTYLFHMPSYSYHRNWLLVLGLESEWAQSPVVEIQAIVVAVAVAVAVRLTCIQQET